MTNKQINMIEGFKGFFKGKDPDILIIVKNSKRGLETFYNPEVIQSMKPYKKQIVSFLSGVIEEITKDGRT